MPLASKYGSVRLGHRVPIIRRFLDVDCNSGNSLTGISNFLKFLGNYLPGSRFEKLLGGFSYLLYLVYVYQLFLSVGKDGISS